MSGSGPPFEGILAMHVISRDRNDTATVRALKVDIQLFES